MKKLLLSLLFALVALTGLHAQTIWDGTADTSWYNETSTEFEISTAEQLAGLAKLVNNGNDFSYKTVRLTADIVLNDTSDWGNWESSASANTWTPIGNWPNLFGGTFDGQGYTVSGIYINSENDHQGLFGYNEGTIKNIGVTKSYIKGNDNVGGVCGNNSYGKISDCYNSGTVSNTGNGSSDVGGVCGVNYEGFISNCYNSGTITGTGNGSSDVGGVCGYNIGSIYNCYNLGNVSGTETFASIGGVCGVNISNSDVSDCYNSGTVSGGYKSGGVCGYNHNGGVISDCYNSGTISGSSGVGGVCGYNNYDISNCYNSGEVSGNSCVGGICGTNNDDSSVSNCYNSGTVNGIYYVGGVCGVIYDGKISNCYYLQYTATGGINGSDARGQAEAKTAEQFASGEVCWLLNEEQSYGAWGQKLGTDPCPVLGGPAVFKDGETYYNEEGSAIIETNSEQASFVIVSENLTINIYGSDGEATVYNLASIIVYQGSERIIPVPNPGIYMVRIGNEVQKTIVR